MSPRICPDCGKVLPPGLPAGMCPNCLLQLAVRPASADKPASQSDPSELSAQTMSPPPGEKSGSLIGRYKLLEQIGEGGFGTVWLAEQQEPVRRKVALKIIKLGMDTREVIARFEAERQALALMDHPNIARVFDGGATDSGRPYFVMELVKGVRVTDYCDARELSTAERLKLFIEVCQAVQHAHQKGIIHRDLKPSNVLVTEQDGRAVPKVIDFGIAKATEPELTEKTFFTRFNQLIGTPAYMSPEQAGLGSLDVDTQSDIYSLGVLLYELLTGRTPFSNEQLLKAGLDQVLRTIREQDPPKPSTQLSTLSQADLLAVAQRRASEPARLNRQVRGDLDWIVMKCLEKDRARRYETANGLARDIERHLNNEPVVARPPSTSYRYQKAFRRNKLVFTAATAVALALLIGSGVSIWQAKVALRAEAGKVEEAKIAKAAQLRAETEQQRADAQAHKATESQQQSRRLLYAADMNLAQQSLKQNNLGRARRLLDRHRPQPGEGDLRGWEWRYLWQQTRGSAFATLTNRLVRGTDVSFSPDGRRLAVGWEDGRVDLWEVPGRRLLGVLTEGADLPEAHVAFSPARNLLAATSSNNVVKLYDLDSGLNSVLWRSASPSKWKVHNLSFSQDGLSVAIYAERGSDTKLADVWVVNASSFQIESHHTPLFTGYVFFGAALQSPDRQRIYLARSDQPAKRYNIQCLHRTTGQEIWQTDTLRDDGLSALAISPDGSVLVSGSGYSDPTIRVWDAASGRFLRRLDGHTSWVAKLVFSKDGRHLISSAADQTIRRWDTGTWTETRVLRGHGDEIHGLAHSEAAQLIASAGKDGNLMLWQAAGQGASDGFTILPGALKVKQVHPLSHSRVLLLPPDKPPELVDLKSDAPPTSLIGIGSSSDVLAVSGTNIICQWDGTNRIVVLELRGPNLVQKGSVPVDSMLRPNGLDYNAVRQSLAWIERTNSASVLLASLASPSHRIELKSDSPGLAFVRWSEDGNYLYGMPKNRTFLRVWNTETCQIVTSIDEPIQSDPMFAAGGRVLVVPIGTRLGHEIVFHHLAQLGNARGRFPGKYLAPGLAVSPDGRLVACPNEAGAVQFFDASKSEFIESIHGHLNGVHGVAFSPDGERLISTSGVREAVKIWDVGTRQELLTLTGIGGTLYGASWSGAGDLILAGAPWQAWRAPSWEEIAAAEAKDNVENKKP